MFAQDSKYFSSLGWRDMPSQTLFPSQIYSVPSLLQHCISVRRRETRGAEWANRKIHRHTFLIDCRQTQHSLEAPVYPGAPGPIYQKRISSIKRRLISSSVFPSRLATGNVVQCNTVRTESHRTGLVPAAYRAHSVVRRCFTGKPAGVLA